LSFNIFMGKKENKKILEKRGLKGRRGPNQSTRKVMVKDMPKNFFRKEHEKRGLHITFANAYDRKNGCIYIQYSLLGSRKKYWSPRAKTAWLDDKGLEYAQNVARKWKEANQNSIGSLESVPLFYVSHRREFIKFLYNTARHTTIEGYERSLIQYVFPYFVGKLELNHPKKWNQDVVRQWDALLEKFVPKPSSRNRKRTALRRYFEFLYKKNLIKIIPLIVGEAVVRETDETPIPGELPNWSDVVNWFRSMQPGRYRFVRAVSCAFGLRISESMAVKYEDFLGAKRY
jgi:integrase